MPPRHSCQIHHHCERSLWHTEMKTKDLSPAPEGRWKLFSEKVNKLEPTSLDAHMYSATSDQIFFDTLVGRSCGALLCDSLIGHSGGAVLADTLAGHSCRTYLSPKRAFHTRRLPRIMRQVSKVSVSYETSSKSHASSLHSERFVRDVFHKSRVKSPKRTFRTRRLPKVMHQASKAAIFIATAISKPTRYRFFST